MLEVVRKRFSAQEFERMAEAGVLAEDDRVELIEGEIVRMNPIGVRHQACVEMLVELFAPLVVRGAARLAVQNSVALGSHNEPYPDIALLRLRPDRYGSARPTATDILLVVEVADTTLGYDLGVKVPLYAGAGVVEVWVVNLGGEQLLLHRDPSPEGYRAISTLYRGGVVAPSALPGFSVDVSAILG